MKQHQKDQVSDLDKLVQGLKRALDTLRAEHTATLGESERMRRDLDELKQEVRQLVTQHERDVQLLRDSQTQAWH